MEIDLEDGPSFVKQRRNVMVICLVVLVASFLDLDYSSFTLFQVTIGKAAAQRLPLGLAFLIWYFVWRLSQCDIPANILQWPQGFAYQYLQEKLPRPDDYEQAEENAKAGYYKDLATKGAKGINVSPTPTTVKHYSDEEMKIKSIEPTQVSKLVVMPGQPCTYVLQFTFNLNHENAQTSRAIEMKLAKNDWLYQWAWIRGTLLASFRKLYFTEYVLPYLMGFICIGYCIFVFASNMK